MDLNELKEMARYALPINDNEWGADRQIAASNRFFETVRVLLSDPDWEKLERWGMKATTEEHVAEAMRLVGRSLPC
jgi:hypothetical protein